MHEVELKLTEAKAAESVEHSRLLDLPVEVAHELQTSKLS